MPDTEKVGGVSIDAEIDTRKLDQSGEKLEKSLNKLDPALKKTERSLNLTEKAANSAAGSINRLELEAKTLREKLESLAPGTQKFIDTARRLSEVERRLKEVRAAADATSKSSSFLKSTFGQLTGAFTAAQLATNLIIAGLRALANAFVGAIKDAVAFETTLARISTVVEGSTKESMAALRKEIIDLSKVYPKSKEELGVGLYNILQAGIDDTNEAMKILEVSTKAAVGGVTEVGTAAKVVTDIMGAYNLTADEAVDVMDAVFVGAQRGKAEFSDLAGSLGNVLQSAAQLNVGIPEVVASIETMVNAGLSSDEAATSLNAFFTAVIQASKGTGEAADLAQDLGLEFDSTALRTKGLRRFMEDLTKAVGDDEVAMQILAGNVRGFRAAASIGGKGAEFFTETLDLMESQTGALNDAFEKNADTTEAKWVKAVNAASNVGEAFGSKTLPAISDSLVVITDALNASIPFVEALGTAFGFVVGQINNAINNLDRFIRMFPTTGIIYNAVRLFSGVTKLFDGGGDSVWTGSITSSGDSTSPTADDNQTKSRRSGSGGTGGDSAQDLKKRRDELLKVEQEILKTLGEQAKENFDNAQLRRDELELRKKLDVITGQETKELERLNRRLVFKKDVVEDATRAWEEQIHAIEDAEERVADLNERIAEEREELQRTLNEIDRDAAEDAVQQAAELIRRRAEIREQSFGSGLTGDQSRELDDIEQQLRGFGAGTLGEAEALATLGPGARVEREKEMRRKEAEEKANARIADLQADVDAENQKLETLRTAEQEKKQIVINALEERRMITDRNFAAIEQRTQQHVNTQIEQFNTLKAALDALTNANAGVAAFEQSIGNRILPGFKSGGYTGDGDQNDPAGIVHRREFVMDAAPTAMYRPILESMKRFTFPKPSSSSVIHNNQREAQITINNHGRAAEVFANPRRARWAARTFLG